MKSEKLYKIKLMKIDEDNFYYTLPDELVKKIPEGVKYINVRIYHKHEGDIK